MKPLIPHTNSKLAKIIPALWIAVWCAPAIGQSFPITVGQSVGGPPYAPPSSEDSVVKRLPVSHDHESATSDQPISTDTFDLMHPASTVYGFPAPPMTKSRPKALSLDAKSELSPPDKSALRAPDYQRTPVPETPSAPYRLSLPSKTAAEPNRGSALTHARLASGETLPVDFGPPPKAAKTAPARKEDSLGWWNAYVSQPMRQESQPLPITLEQIIAAAIQNSAQIRVFSDAPLIRDTEVIESAAEFDWTGFVDSMWYDIDEPVGSSLTTGGPLRFQDHRWGHNMGARRRNTRGGEFEIGQRYGHENTNSIYFVPNNQGTTRLTASYTQPLLRGGGKVYNTSLIVLAQINASIAQDEFANQLQRELLDVTRAYWSLFLDRGSLLQRQRSYKRGDLILTYLEHRQGIDALANQIVRARAAVSSRKADLYRAAASVKNSEARIRALVNAPYLGTIDQFELLPQDSPGTEEFPVDMATSMTLAVKHRPEVFQALKQIRAAAVRLNMAQNELLPLLDMVVESYISGLNGDSDVGQSLRDQFSDGAPSYSAGLQMELPFRNRAVRSRLQRRTIESRQLQSNFEATVFALGLEVETAVREIRTTYREILANYESMKAAESEVDYITKRWKHLAGEDRSASLILEDLLAAQERLQNEELEFLTAQVAYNLAITNLKRVTGSLLQIEQVTVDRVPDAHGNPQLLLNKATYIGGSVGGDVASPTDATPSAGSLPNPLP